MSAAVLPLPLPPARSYPLSRSSTPNASSKPHSRSHTPPPNTARIRSRPCTPPPALAPSSQLNGMQPISAPPTPVITTHLIPTAMERCRSSEAVLASPLSNSHTPSDRDSRKRDVKATSLLFNTTPTSAEISNLERQHGGSMTSKPEWEHFEDRSARNTPVLTSTAEDDLRMDVDEVEVLEQHVEDHVLWGMPKWGWEEERKEVRKGVRLVGLEELPGLVEQHSLIDTPSHVLFPWLHGISDDGRKGSDMGEFFGYGPPFEPPSYRGLCLLLAPPHPLDVTPVASRSKHNRPQAQRADSELTTRPPTSESDFQHEPRERSETMSTSSESYHSSGTTEGTSPSIADWKPSSSPSAPPSPIEPAAESPEAPDVQMHPTESKRVSVQAVSAGLGEANHPLPCAQPQAQMVTPNAVESSSESSSESEEEEEEEDTRPSCVLLNALHVQDIFDLPKPSGKGPARFRPARLPQQINLRNLHIQQIKYATISDIVLYAKAGVGNGVLEIAEKIAEAQEHLYQARLEDFYVHQNRGEGEGRSKPIRYGVWVVVEPFQKIQQHCPHLVNIDALGNLTQNSHHTDLFEREAIESRAMTRGSEVVEGFWVGNDCDVPGGADDGAGCKINFDLCVRASECCDMPSPGMLSAAQRKLLDLDKRKREAEESGHSWVPSPATIALRNLLSPASSPIPLPDVGSKRVASPTPHEDSRQRRPRRSVPDNEYVSLDCAGSCRTMTGQMRNLSMMTDRMVDLVYFLRKLVEGKDRSGRRRQILVHCQDGYTESSILVLSYIMSSLSCSLSEAFLHLQLQSNRSFFLYPSDKPLLRKVDARLAADRRAKAIKIVSTAPSPPSPTTRWKNWGLGFAKPENGKEQEDKKVVEVARDMLVEEENGGSSVAAEARVWFDDRRFDGFPSRILPFLYLGNLDHAGNAGMLRAIGVTHVVSVGESLINCPPDCDPSYGRIGENTLCAAVQAGRIQVLDLADIRDDGNDPLRPLIARACEWIETARQNGGCTLVHCRVGVSRSASIVIAYLMQYHRMGLMDAYLFTRARRLNVLIQPNLRFFHELFGWEVELAKREAAQAETGPEGYKGSYSPRRIMYSWPSFCRDIHCLNRRFLCN